MVASYSTAAAILLDCDPAATGFCSSDFLVFLDFFFFVGCLSTSELDVCGFTGSSPFVPETFPIALDCDSTATGFCRSVCSFGSFSNATVFVGRTFPSQFDAIGCAPSSNFASLNATDRLWECLFCAERRVFRRQQQCSQQDFFSIPRQGHTWLRNCIGQLSITGA